jgi:glutathione synthase/RimK-type ligase-like ATP-grasp enzyme
MKIAVQGQRGFSRRWIEKIPQLGHESVVVSGYCTDIVEQLRGCDILLWHINQDEDREIAFARSVLLAAEAMGLRVFPNHKTCWHFDDKVAQKYLLEASCAPMARTWVFYSRDSAIEFLQRARFPLVFKLRGGAGSTNVSLVPDRIVGERVVHRMFGRGVPSRPPVEMVKRALGRALNSSPGADPLLVRARRVLRRWRKTLLRPQRDQNYVLFQQYIPGNDHDVRVTVIGERAFTFRRNVRTGDFRASGSGDIVHLEASEVPQDLVEIACDLSRRLGFQSMAYDFVRRQDTNEPVLLEISYVFADHAVYDCPGYFTPDGTWQGGHVWPQDAILDDLLAEPTSV